MDDRLVAKVNKILSEVRCDCPYAENAYYKVHTEACVRDNLPYEYYQQPDLSRFAANRTERMKIRKRRSQRFQ